MCIHKPRLNVMIQRTAFMRNYSVYWTNFVRTIWKVCWRFQCKLRIKDIFKSINGKQSLHENINDNRDSVCHIKISICVNTMFHITKFISIYGILLERYNQLGHILAEWRSSGGADCDTDHCLVVTKLFLSDTERFYLKTQDDAEVKEQCAGQNLKQISAFGKSG
jgi:hypothetical protein